MMPATIQCDNTHCHYRIVAECRRPGGQVPLAGFCAEEHTEAILFRHLQNLCIQSDGTLLSAHDLLCGMMTQWKTTLSIPASQMLRSVAATYPAERLRSVCLYKTDHAKQETLINRILL